MMDARHVTRTLRGRWFGGYGAAPCPVCQPEGRRDQNALTVTDGGDRRLLLHCKKAGCSFRDILKAAGLGSGIGAVTSHDPLAEMQRRAERRADAVKHAKQARRVWPAAQPIGGTLGETYLRGRGITCPLPDTLRFHPTCWHPTAKRFPALVALVDGSDSFAVHRTYLRGDGTGKADIKPAKAMLGPVVGGAVRLLDGDGPLVVAEGIETSLSLADALADLSPRVWAALSTSGVSGLRLPRRPGDLTLAPDGDPPRRKAAQTLARCAHAEGWRVRIMAPPGDGGADWNDRIHEVPK